jgi:hypothetical protein
MRQLGTACLTCVVALSVLNGSSMALTPTEVSYLPGGLTLAAGQSVSTGAITLGMNSDCNLTLSNASGQLLWQSGTTRTSCTSPQAAFDSGGSLVVSSSVDGQTTTLWTSLTSGSSELILSQAVPYLEITNSDDSAAWKAQGAMTLADINPAMVATIGERGGLYSQYIHKELNLPISSGDRVDNFQASDGDEVQILIKAPTPPSTEVYYVPPYPITPGQTVSSYLYSAIAYAKGANPAGTIYGSVVFPKATYEVEDFPGCDEARGANGYVHWQIVKVTDLTIDGRGSTLNFNGLCQGIQMDGVQRIAFKNFNLAWPKIQLASLATVEGVNSQTQTMKLVFDPNYHVDENTVFEYFTAWDREHNYWSLKTPNEDEGANYSTYRYLGGQTFLVYNGSQAIFHDGDTVLARHFAGEAPALVIIESDDVDVDTVNVSGATGSAFQFTYGRGFRLANSQVFRAPGSLISIAGDAVHMTTDEGNIIIEGNTIGYQGDDGLNLNTWMMCNSMKKGTNARPCYPTLGGDAGGSASSLAVYSWWENLWLADDQLLFLDPNLFFTDLSTIQNVVTDGHVLTQLNFASPSPAQAQFVVDLRLNNARYMIRNNSFLHNRARGVLLQTSEGQLTGNTFDGQTMHSIYVISSPFWGEGPGAQNLLVANNKVVTVGNYNENTADPSTVLGAIIVAAENNQAYTIPSWAPLHQNVIFSGNVVEDTPGPGFFISTANNVIMQDNQLVNTNQALSWIGTYGTATSAGSIVVTQATNVFFQGNEIEGTSGPISIDTESTSGISGLPAAPR